MALKPAQQKFLDELLNPAHRSIEAAAQAAGVPRRTAYTWLERADFRVALDAAEGQNVDAVARRSVSALTHCEGLYLTMMADKTKPDAIRLRAAQLLSDLALRLWEARNLERRIAQLESATNDDWIQA